MCDLSLIKVLRYCEFSERTMKRGVCQVRGRRNVSRSTQLLIGIINKFYESRRDGALDRI